MNQLQPTPSEFEQLVAELLRWQTTGEHMAKVIERFETENAALRDGESGVRELMLSMFVDAIRGLADAAIIKQQEYTPAHVAVAVRQLAEQAIVWREENAAIRAELEALKKCTITHAEWKPGVFTAEMRGNLLPAFAQLLGDSLGDSLDGEGAVNLVEWTVTHQVKGPLIMSIRRKWGKTDLELRTEAVAQRDEILDACRELVTLFEPFVDDLDYDGAFRREWRQAIAAAKTAVEKVEKP